MKNNKEPSHKWLKKAEDICDLNQGVEAHLPVTGESEAIEMIKWIRENYEPEFGDGRHWEDILDEAETPISDKELYNLYKQSKK